MASTLFPRAQARTAASTSASICAALKCESELAENRDNAAGGRAEDDPRARAGAGAPDKETLVDAPPTSSSFQSSESASSSQPESSLSLPLNVDEENEEFSSSALGADDGGGSGGFICDCAAEGAAAELVDGGGVGRCGSCVLIAECVEGVVLGAAAAEAGVDAADPRREAVPRPAALCAACRCRALSFRRSFSSRASFSHSERGLSPEVAVAEEEEVAPP